MVNEMIYDVIIIGKGPAGISSSIYARRSNLNVLVLGLDDSALLKATSIDNYYGMPKVNGKTLFYEGINQAEDLGVIVKTEEVVSINFNSFEPSNYSFKVKTIDNEYISKTVIIACGTKRSLPNIANLSDYIDKNLSFCAVCDGFFYRNKKAFVLGSGDYALSEAMELSKNASEVVILSNGIFLDVDNEKIKVDSRKICRFIGENKLSQIEFEDKSVIDVPSLFIAWNNAGGYDFAKKIGAMIKDERIVVDEEMKTSVPGLFACGDVTGPIYQVSKAVYEGAIAGAMASNYILKNKRN